MCVVQYYGESYRKGGNFEPKNVTESIDTLLDEIHAILDTGPFQSEEEKDMYLHKLYSLLAASNNTRVHDMIQYIRENYGEWER